MEVSSCCTDCTVSCLCCRGMSYTIFLCNVQSLFTRCNFDAQIQTLNNWMGRLYAPEFVKTIRPCSVLTSSTETRQFFLKFWETEIFHINLDSLRQSHSLFTVLICKFHAIFSVNWDSVSHFCGVIRSVIDKLR